MIGILSKEFEGVSNSIEEVNDKIMAGKIETESLENLFDKLKAQIAETNDNSYIQRSKIEEQIHKVQKEFYL